VPKIVSVIEGARRLGDPAVVVANSSKAQEELNWQPEYSSLDAIIRDAWKALN